MAIQTTNVTEQLKKLEAKKEEIRSKREAEEKAIEAEMAKLKDSVRHEQYAKLFALLDDIKGIGEHVWDIGNKAVAHLGLPVLREGKKAGRTRAPKSEGTKRTRTSNPDKECPICNFKTVPAHDGRKHRSQSEKKPFTAEELHSMGMERAKEAA